MILYVYKGDNQELEVDVGISRAAVDIVSLCHQLIESMNYFGVTI
jgi:hypothetical protein